MHSESESEGKGECEGNADAAESDMELDGRIDGEDDENTSDGEVGRVVEEMVRTTHPHSLLFIYIYIVFFLRSLYLWCLQSYTSPEYGHIFTPDH